MGDPISTAQKVRASSSRVPTSEQEQAKPSQEPPVAYQPSHVSTPDYVPYIDYEKFS